MSQTKERTVYHVTKSESASEIVVNGFMGGWGDAGFGVYFYNSLSNAEAYAARGGWNGCLDPVDAVIIAVTIPVSEVEYIPVHPAWPNPQDYEDVLWHEMDGDDDLALWTPQREIVKGPSDAIEAVHGSMKRR